ncbi:hypothetical protein BDV12DRAFT_184266 [Aspergillus spectabilis]
MHSTSEDLEKGDHNSNVDNDSQIHRTDSYSSYGTSSSDDASDYHDNTQPGYGLERHPTALSRIATQRSQHTATVGALRSRPSIKPLPEFGAGKPYPPPLPEKEEYVVEFAGPDDPLHPQNWPTRKSKSLPGFLVSALLAFTTFNSTFTSSIFSAANTVVSSKFNVSTEVGTLGLSLYVLGFAFGPTLFSPLSELFGRRLPILIGVFGFTVFQFGVATAENLQTVIICRFFGGFFGACPLAVVAAVFSDIYDNRNRGLAITIFTMMVFTGPLFAPFIGGFIVESYLGWRWTEYLTGINGAYCRHTHPVVLIQKAGELRRRTKNWGIHAKQEEVEIDLRELIAKNFSRPVRILFSEPVLLLLSIYMAFLYGLLYLFMTAYPIVFQQIHGFNKGVGGLPYFGLIIGELFGGLFIIAMQPWYNRKLTSNNDIPIPEWRLPPAIIGAAAFAAGLFWFGWSGYSASIHWIIPTVSGLLTGFGLLCIFLQCLNYIIDTYLVFLHSFKNIIMLTILQFNALGVNWTGTLLGCVAAVLMPMPLLFYLYGSRIRQKSKFATDYTNAVIAHDDK